MEEIFGLSMNILMPVLLGIFLAAMAVVVVLAWRNRIMLKMGLRNIPRRRGQTALIIIGVMLSTVIMASAFGTGDTLAFSIRQEAIKSLKTVDEIIVSTDADADDSLGSSPYFPFDRFVQLQGELADLDTIDGLLPQIGESAPVVNARTSLSEGRANIVGIDPAFMRGFGPLTSVSGGEVKMDSLVDGQVYVNDEAAEELEAEVGDTLRLFIEDEVVPLDVAAIVERGGLAGAESTLLLPLSRTQAIFGRQGQINSIVVSNRGDEVSGNEHSEDVTKELRILFNDREVATRLKELLNQETLLEALEAKQDDLGESEREDVSSLRTELQRDELSDELNSLLADRSIVRVIMEELEAEELNEIEREASTLFSDLADFNVFPVKRSFLNEADLAGSAVTSIFILFSMFSITVGILLIFLIFVMLSAARKSEMGMARAVGAKRRHLVLMFAFEGTAYAVVSAAVGVVLGLAVSAVMVVTLNRIFSDFGESFQLTVHFEPRSAIVAYCLGMIITFATVAFSAYRVSRLNIVVAIRGLPEALVPPAESPLRARSIGLLRAVFRPVLLLARGVVSLVRLRPGAFVRSISLAVFWVLPPLWAAGIVVGLVRFIWPYLLRGWLTFLLGVFLTIHSVPNLEDIALFTWARVSSFGGGVSLMIVGLGLMLRTALARTSLRDAVRDRVAFTATGLVMLLFWALPMNFFEGLTGDLEGNFDVMFVSGIAMVAAAVWTLMYNTDTFLKALTSVTGGIGRLRPVFVTAVAYPMSAKFRTGLTLAMFALVIFTLVIMSVLTESFSTSLQDAETISGGWDIEGAVNFNTPIENISLAIGADPDLRLEDFDTIGGFTWLPVQMREVGNEDATWHGIGVQAASDDYMTGSSYKFKLIADGYGDSAHDVWQRLREDPSLVVADGQMLDNFEGSTIEFGSPLTGVYYEDEDMSPVAIEVREPLSGTTVGLTIVGVLDRVHSSSEFRFVGMIAPKRALDEAFPFPVPTTHYRFRVADGLDAAALAKGLESSLLEHGMNTEVLKEVLEEEVATGRAFFRLFTGFMALGLLVGVAALGVVSTRAVVERRQQIGMLRAIGYKRRMVQASFLFESSFVLLLGTIIGVALGIVLSYNAVNDIRQDAGIDTIRFTIPWVQIAIILAITYLFSLLTTFLPARQAAKIHPAEALRYE